MFRALKRTEGDAYLGDWDTPILLHERTLAAVLQVDVVRVEVPFRRDHHDLRHRTARIALLASYIDYAVVAAYPLRAAMHRAPLVGNLRKAKSREGSHISVSVFGR